MNNSSSTIPIPEILSGWTASQRGDTRQFFHAASKKEFTANMICDLVIEQCDGTNSVESIVKSLEGRFPQDVSAIKGDVESLIVGLEEIGFIQLEQIVIPTAVVQLTPPARTSQYKMCIGMATYDDYDGVYFSIQAIRLYHPEILDDIEFVVLDNNPTGPCAEALKSLGNSMPNYRYVAGDNFQGTWSRFSLINQTNAPYIMCMDSHVMILPGAIKRLLDYFDTNPETPDFLQGPLVGDDLSSLSSHFTPGWGSGMFGKWASDPRADDVDGDEFDIPMQGLGLFAFRKDHWPQINSRFNGFGGEEGYVHEKVRRAGGRTLCLPFLRWIHRFNRPMGAHYALNWHDRIRNYMIAFNDLKLDTGDMIKHFREHIGNKETDTIVANVVAEMKSPLNFFDAIYCINCDSQPERWLKVHAQFRKLGISHRVQRFSAIETPESHHIGCTLSHRTIIQLAQTSGFNNVLILEDDVIFDAKTLQHLSGTIDEAKTLKWDVLYLGGHCWDIEYPLASGCSHIRDVDQGLTASPALAYSSHSYAKILNDLPDNIADMTQFIASSNNAIDQYLGFEASLKKVVASPRVASQPPLLKQESISFTVIIESLGEQ
jgi:hypothetical protein